MTKFKMPRVIERSYARAIDRLMQGLKRELVHVASPFFIADVLRRLARICKRFLTGLVLGFTLGALHHYFGL